MFAFLDYYDPLMLTCSRHAFGVLLTCMWKKFVFSLSVSFYLFMIPMLYTLMRMYMYMYSDCDYLLSLQILFVYFLALPSLYFILQFYSIIFYTCLNVYGMIIVYAIKVHVQGSTQEFM